MELSNLRQAAEQALEALKDSFDKVRHEYETDWHHELPTRKAQLDGMKEMVDNHEEAIANLRAALAEEALQRLTDVHQEIEAALAEKNKCTHGVEDSCKECYMADEQEPVFDCPRCGHCCPQRKPLSDEEIEQAYRNIWRNISADFDHTSMGWIEQGIRYAEQAHGIKRET